MFQNRIEMPECITTDFILQPPQEGLLYPTFGQQTTPFTLHGSPTPPKAVKGLTEHRRKATATKSTNVKEAYFAEDNYFTINLLSENIITSDGLTTLRFDNLTYTLKFTALHAPIWDGDAIQVSMLFTGPDGRMFHICIPVIYGTNENLYLKYWLSGKKDKSFTANELLNFRTNDVRFAMLDYCIAYNRAISTIKHPYIFCIFKTPLIISQPSTPQWLMLDPLLKNPQKIPEKPFDTYRRKTFDEIFNYFMFGVIRVPVATVPSTSDPYLIGTEEHFDSTRTQAVTQAAYFKMDSKKLSGIAYSKVVEGFESTLTNIKCYPIDLLTQVDKDGNIHVDDTNKPINISALDASASASASLSQSGLDQSAILNKQAEEARFNSNMRYIVIFLIVFIIIIAFVVSIIVYFLQGAAQPSVDFPVPAPSP